MTKDVLFICFIGVVFGAVSGAIIWNVANVGLQAKIETLEAVCKSIDVHEVLKGSWHDTRKD